MKLSGGGVYVAIPDLLYYYASAPTSYGLHAWAEMARYSSVGSLVETMTPRTTTFDAAAAADDVYREPADQLDVPCRHGSVIASHTYDLAVAAGVSDWQEFEPPAQGRTLFLKEAYWHYTP